jgi:putative acetyltransferase
MTTSPTTDTVEAPSWTIRPERPIDLDQIHELHHVAFNGPNEAELVDSIRSTSAFVPELSLVAVTTDGSVLGHLLISQIELAPADPDDEADGRVTVLSLAPIAVLPSQQGRGIGTALMEEGLRTADERDEPMMVVVGAPAFYRRFGFVPAADHGLSGPYDAAGEAFAVRVRSGNQPRAGTLIYPAAFANV